MTARIAGLVLAALVAAGCAPPEPPADLVLIHGKIVTLDETVPEAEALAVRGNRIAVLGTDAEIERLVRPETEVIDLEGKLAIPGFIESHGHLLSLGRRKGSLDLTSAASWEEIVQKVEGAVAGAEPGQWIYGRGWHQEKWTGTPEPNVEGFPTNASLSAVSPDNPVLLGHASGHASIANAMALARSGIDASTPDPPGGDILHDASGNPTGVLRENAQNAVDTAMARDLALRPAEEISTETRRAIELAVAECLANGVTSFQDAGSSFGTVDVLRELVGRGELGIRLWVMIRAPNEELRKKIDEYRTEGDYLTVRAVKRTIDGALGSRGAWLLEPYSDAPETSGLNTATVEDVEETARIAKEHGLQMCVHAIGDRANREVLDLYERVFGPGGGRDLRWRIEHAQHLNPDDIPRFAQLGVIASMQGIHCVSDGSWVVARLGEKRAKEGAYVWRSLLDSGAIIANGTDAPVEDINPFLGFHALVTRELPDGNAFYAEQTMSREEALRSYTLDAAYAAFEEKKKGSLTPGKLADIAVLDQDILTVPEDLIRQTRVVYTIVGGKLAYQLR